MLSEHCDSFLKPSLYPTLEQSECKNVSECKINAWNHWSDSSTMARRYYISDNICKNLNVKEIVVRDMKVVQLVTLLPYR